jgi:hypothetical protein
MKMNKREYAMSIYRVAALKVKKNKSEAEIKELKELVIAQEKFEDNHQAAAQHVLSGFTEGSGAPFRRCN